MPRPGGRIADVDVFGARDTQKIRLGLFRRHVVVHPVGQLRLGAIEQPQPSQRVLDQVADDPVRREELRRGGDVFGRDLLVLL